MTRRFWDDGDEPHFLDPEETPSSSRLSWNETITRWTAATIAAGDALRDYSREFSGISTQMNYVEDVRMDGTRIRYPAGSVEITPNDYRYTITPNDYRYTITQNFDTLNVNVITN